jgi:hypothetical protein
MHWIQQRRQVFFRIGTESLKISAAVKQFCRHNENMFNPDRRHRISPFNTVIDALPFNGTVVLQADSSTDGSLRLSRTEFSPAKFCANESATFENNRVLAKILSKKNVVCEG